MRIERARVMGRCMGVRRAEELALRAAVDAATAGGRVFTLGPLIHNPQAVAALEASGVSVLDTAKFESGELDDSLAGATVVVRAHGAPPEAFRRLLSLGVKIVDATCPRVLASQRRARRYAESGYRVIVAGDAAHGEVAGILGHAPGAFVAGDAKSAARIVAGLPGEKIAVIAQTTIRKKEYEAIKAEIAARCPEFEAFDSICPATEDRQAALAELAAKVEALIVVGGKGSANTIRLYKAAVDSGKPAWHIETAAELPPEIFRFTSVGLTAGASTPDELVDEVERTLASKAGTTSRALPESAHRGSVPS
ncbi:MAG: 4-hydroxy-3-methylbut-2-enyl diphosphate reductase [Rectinemataceae bacterium]